nr:hypothetical protein [Nitrospirota bacterium]
MSRTALIIASLSLTLLAGGCSSALGIWPVAQSHYTNPDAKIVPLGPTRGSAGQWFFTYGGLADVMHPDIAQEAVREAIREKRADLLTDYTLSLRGTRAPIFLIPGLDLWWVSWTAEGTAAKLDRPPPTLPHEPAKGPKPEGR